MKFVVSYNDLKKKNLIVILAAIFDAHVYSGHGRSAAFFFP